MAEANNSNKDKVAQPSISSMQNQQNPELNHWLSLGGVFTGRPAEDPLARVSSSAGALEQAASDPSQLARSSFVPAESGQWLMRHKDTRALRRLEAKKRVAERRAEEAAAASLQEKRMPPPAAPEAPPVEVTRASSTAIYKYRVEGYLSVSTAPNGARSANGMTSRFQAVLVERDRDIKSVLTSSERAKASNGKAGDNDGQAAIAKMPRVRTVGAGGRMIEGNLHKYHRGHVSIKCVCHGSFHSPAEFVKHAGGSEVANPLRHITVVCSPSD